MANTIYVNVGGVWKTVTDYYVNVSGVWKTGTAFANNVSGVWKGATTVPSGPVTFPTALEIAGLEFAEYMCIPHVHVSGKQSVASGTTLDIPEWHSLPRWYRDSVFVYQAPPAGTQVPLPTIADLTTLDLAEWLSVPTVRFSASGSANMAGLDVAEFMCIPYWGLTPTAPSAPPPPPPALPTANQIQTLDYAEFMCIPHVFITSKNTLSNTGLDIAEWLSVPHYSITSETAPVIPPTPGPSTLPTAATYKTLDLGYWQSSPTVNVVSKSSVDGPALDSAEFMCIPYYTKNL